MSKELVLALILGLMVGFGATGTFYALQHRPASTNPPVTTDLSSANPSPTSDNPSGLTNQNLDHQITIKITSPANNSAVSTAKITISGETQPQYTLVLVSTTNPNQPVTTQSDSSGQFSLQASLESGANYLDLYSIDPQTGQYFQTNLYITYSTAKF